MNTTLKKIKQKLKSNAEFSALINQCHTPLYIADKEEFKKNLKDFLLAFRKVYPNSNLGYSFKTNYCDTFIDEIKRKNCYAEVVSPMEYQIAIDKFEPSKIIYNGVIPDIKKKYHILLNGGLAFIENLDDLQTIICLMKKKGKCSIGIRLSFDINNNFPTRFGFWVNSPEYNKCRSLIEREGIKVKAIHCHISYGRSLPQWEIRAEEMIKQARIFDADIIDLGGNMLGRVDEQIREQIENDLKYIPTYEEYAEIIGEKLKAAFPKGEKLLLLECGTPLVGNAMGLIVECIGLKTMKGNSMATINCTNFDVGFVCRNKNAAIYPLDEITEYHSNIPIFGCTCMEKDIIHRAYTGPISRGCKMFVANVGAYGMNVSNGFITEKPSCITI